MPILEATVTRLALLVLGKNCTITVLVGKPNPVAQQGDELKLPC